MSDKQLFITTHSWECLQAARDALTEMDFNDFAVCRIERRADRDVAIEIEEETFRGAIEAGMEIR